MPARRPLKPRRRRPRPTRSTAREVPLKRQIILDAARLLYSRTDSSNVTMREIAKEVSCQSPSLYHHFASKEEIFRALVQEGDRLFERYRSDFQTDDCLERLRERFRRYYEFSKRYTDYFMLLFVDPASPAIRKSREDRARLGAETRRLVAECVAAGRLPPNTDPGEAGQVLWCAMHGVSVLRLRQGVAREEDFDRLAERTLDLVLDGICAGLLGSHASLAPATIGDAAPAVL